MAAGPLQSHDDLGVRGMLQEAPPFILPPWIGCLSARGK
jgi:hypothetical protein